MFLLELIEGWPLKTRGAKKDNVVLPSCRAVWVDNNLRLCLAVEALLPLTLGPTDIHNCYEGSKEVAVLSFVLESPTLSANVACLCHVWL